MERLSIGELAHATGLSVRALRHYQDLGLLVPAGVDPATRYRAYGPTQLERALAIARLRRLGLPLTRIRDYLAAAPAERRRLLQDHRAELDARLRSTAQFQHELDRLIGPAHERRNLGFDEAGPDGVLPASWGGGGERYARGLDTSVTHSPGPAPGSPSSATTRGRMTGRRSCRTPARPPSAAGGSATGAGCGPAT
jgi:DNA-binding transcriptional MerR regulator